MKTVCLVVLDGWGIAPPGPGNAIALAQPRHIDALWNEYPHTMLEASGTTVGLLPGFIGNSEVGHLHLGAGRLVKQDVAKISEAIKNNTFYKNKTLLQAMKKKTVHLLGLASDAGVHSHINHLLALIKMCAKQKVRQVFVHAITDGRDTPPKSAQKYVGKIEKELAKHNKAWKIATITGRYYAMDRDKHWDRTKKAAQAILQGKGTKASNAKEAIAKAYDRGETDEFIQPTIIIPEGTIKNSDSVIFFNLRTDRARQLAQEITKNTKASLTCMVEYSPELKCQVAYPHQPVKNTLGEIISKHKLKQYRIAETEKWAHVTYFFNGLTDKTFNGEKRELVPSAKVKTFDKKPEMSAVELTKKTIEALKTGNYAFILVNFANPDMVGHTGKIDATIKAVKTVDECVAHIVATAQNTNADVIITADHGNAEQKLYPDGSACTAHTTNKVPFILVSNENHRIRKIKGTLYHVAPTVLHLMGLERPEEMAPGLVR